MARLLSVELDVSRTAEVALDLVARATNADRGFLILADGAEAFGLRGGQERPPETSEGILREVQRTNETVLVVDAASDARFGERGSIKTIGARSVLAVPVRDPDAATIAAVIYLDAPSAPARFGARERELAEALAGAIAVPLGNARRFEAQSLELVEPGREDLEQLPEDALPRPVVARPGPLPVGRRADVPRARLVG
ncbi:GAF domain-containing protein, partial [bacterium]|nr:GAF domain-containing protein [bacterium]